jgi:hypothetical protein
MRRLFASAPTCAPLRVQFKEYSTHLEHHLKDACGRSADFVAKQQAYGEALAEFGAQAANMSKYEESAAASAFMDLQAAAAAVAAMHDDVSTHVNRCRPVSAREYRACSLVSGNVKTLFQSQGDPWMRSGLAGQFRACCAA